jgi:hypothetical protein
VMCALISGLCAALLFRSWRRGRSALVRWVAIAFAFLTASNILLIVDLLSPLTFTNSRAALIAVGLGFLIYGLVWEEHS